MQRFRDRARALGQRFTHSPVGRAVHRFNHFRGTRLAGTVTFYGFLSVFPILVLAFSLTLRVVGSEGVVQLESFVEEYIPGIAEQLALQQVRESAASLQIFGAAALLVTGLGWVDATRASVRAMWGLPDRDGNIVARKLVDLLVLAGLGLLVAVSLVASTWVSGEGEQLLEWLNQDGSTAGVVATNTLAQVLASLTATALVAYIIAGLPRIRIPWRVLLPAALVGGVALEILKRVLIGYISGFAGNNTYGAFGVPVALLIWIYVIARLLMVIAAWTAERCNAPLVQPRFVEAAAALRAAGDVDADADQVEQTDPTVDPPGQQPVDSTAGREIRTSATRVPAGALALGAGVMIGMLLGRRGRRGRAGRR